jgi:hypothetical protein
MMGGGPQHEHTGHHDVAAHAVDEGPSHDHHPPR